MYFKLLPEDLQKMFYVAEDHLLHHNYHKYQSPTKKTMVIFYPTIQHFIVISILSTNIVTGHTIWPIYYTL